MSLDRVGYAPETTSWSIVTAATTPAVISGVGLLDTYIFTNGAVLAATLPSATLVYPGFVLRLVNSKGTGVAITIADPATSIADGTGRSFLCVGSTWRAI